MNQEKIWMADLWDITMPKGAKWKLQSGFEFRAYLGCYLFDKPTVISYDQDICLGHEWLGNNQTKGMIRIDSITRRDPSNDSPIIDMIADDGVTYFIINNYFIVEEGPWSDMILECVLKPMFGFYHIDVIPNRSYPSFSHLAYTWRIRKIYQYMPDGISVREMPGPVEISQRDFLSEGIEGSKEYFLECEIVGE